MVHNEKAKRLIISHLAFLLVTPWALIYYSVNLILSLLYLLTGQNTGIDRIFDEKILGNVMVLKK